MSSAELGALKISTAKLPEHQQPPGDLLNLQRSKNRCSGGAGDLALVVQEMGTHLLGLLGQQRAALAPFCRAMQTPSTSTPFPRGRKGCGLRARSVWRSFCLGAKHWHPEQGGWVPPCHRLRSPAGLGDPILRRAASRGARASRCAPELAHGREVLTLESPCHAAPPGSCVRGPGARGWVAIVTGYFRSLSLCARGLL